MNISTEAIVSNSEITKNYKACREKADSVGKVFVFKNNQPDAVLFPILAYEKLASLIEYLETLDDESVEKIVKAIPTGGIEKLYFEDSSQNICGYEQGDL